MENWHVDPTTGLMITTLPNGDTMVGVPNKPVLMYAPDEVEHVTLVTRPQVVRSVGVRA